MYRSLLIGVKITRDEFNDILRRHRVPPSDALKFLAQRKIEIESFPGEDVILIGRKEFSGKTDFLTIALERWAKLDLATAMQNVARDLANIGIQDQEIMVFIT